MFNQARGPKKSNQNPIRASGKEKEMEFIYSSMCSNPKKFKTNLANVTLHLVISIYKKFMDKHDTFILSFNYCQLLLHLRQTYNLYNLQFFFQNKVTGREKSTLKKNCIT